MIVIKLGRGKNLKRFVVSVHTDVKSWEYAQYLIFHVPRT